VVYQSLYRRHRPRRFGEVRGQEHVVRALHNAVREDRVGHAYLFSGPRGTGKTTSARILAKVLNCERPVDGEPCCECPSCLAVEAGTSFDVHEMDAASNNGVDAMRDLIERAMLGTPGRRRVYILDEVHMLSKAAEAALLKTLEEPPSGVTMILSADAEEPLLPTIRSRCARLRLGPVGVREIESILGEAALADAPLAARLARIADGRPGVAVAWARDPEGLLVRDELARVLVDLADRAPADRLQDVRAAAVRASRLTGVLDRPGDDGAAELAGRAAPARGRRGAAGARAAVDADAPAPAAAGADAAIPDPDDEPAAATRTPASERRRAVEVLIALWIDLARDLLLLSRDLPGSVRELVLLDELQARARDIDPVELAAAMDRLARAQVLLANNVSPELLLDDLALAWPAPRRAAA
jgi:nucleoid-associated protein YgaU